ncbi:hypothetical protein LV779_18210 [Streptomyces thinghirensis]|nr:hypothetical protein [Streptomyces thinghirensis]
MTGMLCPVTEVFAAEARNTTTRATLGCASSSRLSGARAAYRSATPKLLAIRSSLRKVRVRPGSPR